MASLLVGICSFLWGALCAVFTIDMLYEFINIYWWVYFILLIILFIVTAITRIVLYIANCKDYEEMASAGYSVLTRVIADIKKRRDKHKE